MDTQVFVVSSSKYLNQTHSDSISELVAAEEKDYEIFDDFVSNGLGMSYKITMKCDSSKFLTESICACRSFQTTFICKHIKAYHLKLMKVPKQADSKVIDKKIPRGKFQKSINETLNFIYRSLLLNLPKKILNISPHTLALLFLSIIGEFMIDQEKNSLTRNKYYSHHNYLFCSPFLQIVIIYLVSFSNFHFFYWCQPNGIKMPVGT